MRPAELLEILVVKAVGTAIGCIPLWLAIKLGWEIWRCGNDVGAVDALANVFIGLPIVGICTAAGCGILYATYFAKKQPEE